MIFDDLGDNRQSRGRCPPHASSYTVRAAAAGSRGGKPLPLSMTSICRHVRRGAETLISIRPFSAASFAVAGGDALRRILHDVGERLRQQPPVEPREIGVLGQVLFDDVHVGVADAHQEKRPAGRIR